MRKQVEIPVHDNTIQTLRSLDPESQANKNLFKKKTEEITDITSFNKLLKEVIIRFDTDPSYYQKDDFKKLISLIARSLKYFYTLDFNNEELIILNQKIELLKQKLLEFGTISKEQIDSLFEDLETEIPYPTKTKKYTEEVIFDFAYWQKPGAKPGTKILITNAKIPDEKNNGYGTVWGKFFVNKPENFLVTVGTLYKVGDTDEYIGQIENITGTLRILQCFQTTDSYGEPYFKPCYWNENIEDDKLYVDNYNGIIKVKYTNQSWRAKKLNVCISVADYFNIEKLPDSKIYSLESELNSYKWNLVPVNQSEYKCKYHKLKVQNDGGTLRRSTWRIYNRAGISSINKKIYLCKKGTVYYPKRGRHIKRMGWVIMKDQYQNQSTIKHRMGVRGRTESQHAYIMYYDGNKYQSSNGVVYKYTYVNGVLNESTRAYIKDIQPLKIAY